MHSEKVWPEGGKHVFCDTICILTHFILKFYPQSLSQNWFCSRMLSGHLEQFGSVPCRHVQFQLLWEYGHHLYGHHSITVPTLFRTPPQIQPWGSINIYIIMYWAKWGSITTTLVCTSLKILQPPGSNRINTVHRIYGLYSKRSRKRSN
jgi:hypothetical protein